MPYDLAAMAHRAQPSRRTPIVLSPIMPTASDQLALGAILVRFVAAWRAAVHERLLPAYNVETDPEGGAVAAALTLVENASYPVLLEQRDKVYRWAVAVERWHRRRWAVAVRQGAGLDVAAMLEPAPEPPALGAHAIIGLLDDLDASLRNDLLGAVYRALQIKAARTSLSAAVADIIERARRRALFIASDQLAKLTTSLDRARQEEAGLASYQWFAAPSGDPAHAALDGMWFKWTAPPDAGPPGHRPRCGCRARALISIRAA